MGEGGDPKSNQKDVTDENTVTFNLNSQPQDKIKNVMQDFKGMDVNKASEINTGEDLADMMDDLSDE